MRQAVRAIIIKDNSLLVMDRNKFGNQYCALAGGGIDAGETPVTAIVRELREETTIEIANPRLVIVEDAGPIYGVQYIYLCDYVSGDPQLSPDSEEYKINALGQNLYTPKWLPLAELADANLLPKELKQMLIDNLASGFPDQPLELTIHD